MVEVCRGGGIKVWLCGTECMWLRGIIVENMKFKTKIDI